ncbi:hypothetical protein C8R44DRAFT_729357 [Mycena epipterygia]|nr:hypothetical protein C8R44DRAFT_729357 [Mycena epipterygia]
MSVCPTINKYSFTVIKLTCWFSQKQSPKVQDTRQAIYGDFGSLAGTPPAFILSIPTLLLHCRASAVDPPARAYSNFDHPINYTDRDPPDIAPVTATQKLLISGVYIPFKHTNLACFNAVMIPYVTVWSYNSFKAASIRMSLSDKDRLITTAEVPTVRDVFATEHLLGQIVNAREISSHLKERWKLPIEFNPHGVPCHFNLRSSTLHRFKPFGQCARV